MAVPMRVTPGMCESRVLGPPVPDPIEGDEGSGAPQRSGAGVEPSTVGAHTHRTTPRSPNRMHLDAHVLRVVNDHHAQGSQRCQAVGCWARIAGLSKA